MVGAVISAFLGFGEQILEKLVYSVRIYHQTMYQVMEADRHAMPYLIHPGSGPDERNMAYS
jgi:hypothetical protein